MNECKNCNSKLVVNGINPGQQIRCANCSALSTFGVAEAKAADRLAWRSLYLGLASILLMFFTGIPAIYYGIKSLLRMRIAKTKPSDRAAAIAGVATGGCFGICLWGMVLITGIAIAVAVSTRTEVVDPVEIARLCAEEFKLQPPPSCKPYRYVSMLGMREYYFEKRLKEKEDDRGFRQMSLLAESAPKSPQSDGMFIATLKSHRMPGNHNKTESTLSLDWEFNGQPMEVRKLSFTKRDADLSSEEKPIRAIQYYGAIEQDGIRYGMSLIFDPTIVEIEESKIQELFSSTKIVPRK